VFLTSSLGVSARSKAVISRSAVNAAAIGIGFGLMVLAGLGCQGDSRPTSLFLTIEAEHATDPPPDELRVSVYGDNGVTFRDQRLPATGLLVPLSSTSLGTVTIYLPEKTGHARLDVRALLQGALRLEGVLQTDVRTGKQVAVTVTLRSGALPDGDGDGVPDAIDDCPMTANANQVDMDGDGIGDLCQGGTDGGTTEAGTEAGREAGADASADNGTDAAADATTDASADKVAGADAGTDAGADAAADIKMDSATDSGTDSGTDSTSVVDAGTDRATDTTTGADTGPDGAMEAGVVVDSGPDVPPGGLLTITEMGFRADVNLTAEGTIDWAHWGAGSTTAFNHKTSGARKISDLSQRPSFRYNTSATTFAWSDGTPTTSDSNNAGVYDLGSSASFSMTVPADTSTRTLRLYVGGNDVDNRLTAHLSDSSVPNAVFSTTGKNNGGAYVTPLEITFRAAATLQTLTLTWTALGSGGVTSWNAATLF
jgi:hypothetical protein